MIPATAPSRGWVKTQGACPACGRSGWCTRSADGIVVKCQRAESAKPIKQKDGTTAWLHLAANIGGNLAPAKAQKVRPRLKVSEVTAIIKQHQTSISPKRLAQISDRLGLTERSLKAYGVGYDIERGAYSFPMFDGQLKPIGIRLRTLGGDKSCVPGSRNGLFIPNDYEAFSIPVEYAADAAPLLMLPEGPTDAAAARDMGFRAIGRPSNIGGVDLLCELLQGRHKQEVIVVVADRDETKYLKDGTPFWPGIEGAMEVCNRIIHIASRVQFLLPPAGIKDLRDWLSEDKKAIRTIEPDKCGHFVTREWLQKANLRLRDRKLKERRAPAA